MHESRASRGASGTNYQRLLLGRQWLLASVSLGVKVIDIDTTSGWIYAWLSYARPLVRMQGL